MTLLEPPPVPATPRGHAHHLSRPILDALRSGHGPAPVVLRGLALLADPVLNKDAAFTEAERDALGLRGLLPPRVVDIDQQVVLELEHVRHKTDDLERYIGLAALQDRNETLFHRVLGDHLEELLPIVYTPTVGRACQEFSHLYRRPRGVWITPDDVDRVPEILRHAARDEIRLIVVTDNERILGLGDQGAGGMGIPIGKLALYSAAAGIHPGLTLPVSLDVGTDREALLADPLYVGWRHPRLRGEAYDAVVEAFVAGVREVHPRAVLQWEDFKQHNAIRLLARYRNWVCSFNDDIQGTAAIAVATILSALRSSGQSLEDSRIVLAGAGAAGTGIARLLAVAMVDAGRSPEEARDSIAVLDSHGLVVEGRAALDDDKRDAAVSRALVTSIGLDPDVAIGLEEVVRAFRPSVLLGTTGTGGAFTEGTVRAMAAAHEHPIILPLSNPTMNTEARPADIFAWTDGRAIVATGSPFPPVELGGSSRRIPQANNAYVFPGIGLGAIVSEARTLPESAFLVAARRLADLAPGDAQASGQLFPPIGDLRSVAREIAIAVVAHLGELGVGRRFTPDQIPAAVEAAMWRPDYVPYEAV
ncbi:MAG TPA: NAD-dependent malic enzyme [Candidatus Limnocylindrales bacterium]|nr:NAD-dependent malic enzyme [Candidatus Limnocylindrales bacterium]